MKFLEHLLKIYRRLFLKHKKFTIISNNCWGGVVYKYFGLKYQSPTAGLLFPAKDYLNFCGNLKHYISQKLEQIDVENSNNYPFFSKLSSFHKKSLIIGRLGDVEICFLHYQTFEEAREKWSRRCKRIVFDNIIYKNNDNNEMNEDLLRRWDDLLVGKNTLFITCKKELFDASRAKVKLLINQKLKGKDAVDDIFHMTKYTKLPQTINYLLK